MDDYIKHGLRNYCVLFLLTFLAVSQALCNQGCNELLVLFRSVKCFILYVNRYQDIRQYPKDALVFMIKYNLQDDDGVFQEAAVRSRRFFFVTSLSAALTSNLLILETHCFRPLAFASATRLRTKHERSKRNKVNG